MQIFQLILRPLLGGIIGYITNDIAIWMLFHPREPVFLGSWQLPFTPGLIPQQKDRIAGAIGRMVDKKLLDPKTLKAPLLSEKTLSAVRSKVMAFLDRFGEDERSIREFLEERYSYGEIEQTKEDLSVKIADYTVDTLLEENIGKTVAEEFIRGIRENMQNPLLSELIFGGLRDPIENLVNNKVREKGPGFISSQLAKSADKILDNHIADIYSGHRDKAESAADLAVELYTGFVDNNLEEALSTINIESIVEEKIRAFSPKELEELVFGIMRRELRAIVYLGAFLGFIMGLIYLLFP